MRKIILKMHVSLDGFVRAADGDVMGWLNIGHDPELTEWEVAILWQAGVHVMGRRVYEDMARYWPNSTEIFARPMNEIPKVIFSKTIHHSNWQGTRIYNGDLLDEILRMKQESGKDILAHGGPGFAQSLSDLGLIDEYRLIVHPVYLGKGLPLFMKRIELKLQISRSFPGGTVAITYNRG